LASVTDNDCFKFLFAAAIFTENTPPETRRINFEQKSVNLPHPPLLFMNY